MVQTSTTKTARLKGRVPEHQKVRVKPDCIKDTRMGRPFIKGGLVSSDHGMVRLRVVRVLV